MSIRDAADEPVVAGETGNIFVRSSLVFEGYLRSAASDTRPLSGGWWTAGDRGRLDSQGYLYVTGRGSNLIITGRSNVQPEEVEVALSSFEGVAASAVVGMSDPTWGDIVCVVVVLERGAELTRRDLRRHAAETLARHKRPRRYFEAADSLPKTRSGKLDRRRVQEVLMSDVGPRGIR